MTIALKDKNFSSHADFGEMMDSSDGNDPATNGDVSVLLPTDFTLESGDILRSHKVRLRFQGNPDGKRVIGLGGISAGRAVADIVNSQGVVTEEGWWRNIAGYGCAIDLNEYYVIGMDFLPGNDTDIVTITTHDQARALAYALSALGEEKIFGFVGSSYGGMVALAFASLFPERIEKLCVISAAHRSHPAAIAQRGVQRRILALADKCDAPDEGVALARQLAMISYRTTEEFGERFSGLPADKAGASYDVCEYLIARGKQCAMTLPCYVSLSDSIDRHRVDPTTILTDTLLISSKSDKLVLPNDMRLTHEQLSKNSQLNEIDSLYGHDAFLKETNIIGPMISKFLKGCR